MSKELWFQSYEQLLNEFEDEWMDPDTASEKAADMASDHMVERLVTDKCKHEWTGKPAHRSMDWRVGRPQGPSFPTCSKCGTSKAMADYLKQQRKSAAR